MADLLTYHFDWDPLKARANQLKHEVSFRLAATVFRDPLALTVYDAEHSLTEERWATLGLGENGQLLVAAHTFQHINPATAMIRIISARKATRQEIRDYENTPR